MLKDLPKSLIEAAKALKVDVKSNTHGTNLRKREDEISSSHGANVKEELTPGAKKVLGDKAKEHGGKVPFTSTTYKDGKKVVTHGYNDEKGNRVVTRTTNEEVDEALKGGQHKIDKNKNGRIDGQDFKILRGTTKAKAKPQYDKARPAFKEEAEVSKEVQFSAEELARIQEIINGTTDK